MMKKLTARVPKPATPRELPKLEVRSAYAWKGRMLASIITKPIGHALRVLLIVLASQALAATSVITAPNNAEPACPFPGCKGVTNVIDVTMAPYNVVPGAPGAVPPDMSGRVQMAIDTGLSLYFPAGTYAMCNVQPRAQNQTWLGAGVGQTIFVGTSGCNNTIATSFGGVFGGPSFTWEVEGISFQQSVQAALAVQCRDMAAHVFIHDSAFDTGGIGCPTTSAGPTGISMTGCRDFVIRDNEFYSSCPGSGGRGIFGDGIRGGLISGNRSNWQRTFIEIASSVNRPIEFTNISDNTYHGTFWGTPTKYTNSGATVSYAGTVLTDTAASFAGLCDAGGASPCAAAAGSFVRVLTSKVASTANWNTSGGMLVDAASNFTGLGVQRGDLVKTANVCFGNGTLGQQRRFLCTGSAGTSSWGDSCVCTANADCASNICEPRWATVDTVGDTHTIQVDEWSRETACPLGGTVCASSSRRPTGAILTTAAVGYTIYGWTACQIASYTGTTITCNADGWFSWTGSATTPANTTLYEVSWTRPLYFLLAGNTGITAVQGLRVVNNSVSSGFADHFELTGTRMVVEGNHSRDCGDTCFVFAGDQYTVGNNVAEHCGARGMIALGNDQTWGNNIAVDSPWIRVSNTTTAGEMNINGSRNTLVGNKVKAELPVNLNRYGYVVFGNASVSSDQNLLDTNTCQGTYSAGCYRLDATGGTSTNTHFINYHGETISNNGGTFSIEGGFATQAQVAAVPTALLINGSYLGCSDCTVASPCASLGNGALAKRQNGVWVCN